MEANPPGRYNGLSVGKQAEPHEVLLVPFEPVKTVRAMSVMPDVVVFHL